MQFNVQEQGERGVLVLEGDLNVEHAGELKKTLLDALNSVRQVSFDVEKLTSLDLSCLQLLCSAHRTASLMGKELIQTGNSPVELEETIKSAGYPRTIGCTEDMANDCLWIRRGKINA
jgi:anti-anti-sigma factor